MSDLTGTGSTLLVVLSEDCSGLAVHHGPSSPCLQRCESSAEKHRLPWFSPTKHLVAFHVATQPRASAVSMFCRVHRAGNWTSRTFWRILWVQYFTWRSTTPSLWAVGLFRSPEMVFFFLTLEGVFWSLVIFMRAEWDEVTEVLDEEQEADLMTKPATVVRAKAGAEAERKSRTGRRDGHTHTHTYFLGVNCSFHT